MPHAPSAGPTALTASPARGEYLGVLLELRQEISGDPVGPVGGCDNLAVAFELASAVLRNQVAGIPPLARWREARILGRGYAPHTNSAEWVTWVYANLARNVRNRREISGTVLELGPGGNLGCSLLFLVNGCERAYCIDVFPFVVDNDDLYEELVDDPSRLLAEIEYRCPESIEGTTLPDGSCDIIFSSAVLEHVSQPTTAVRRIAALLKPGGVTTHGIDLRDHRDFGAPLDFLRHSDRVWEAAMSRRVYTNRWRASDWCAAFEEAGLNDIEIVPKEQIDVSDATRRKMSRCFRAKSLHDLSVTQIELTASKPFARPHLLEPASELRRVVPGSRPLRELGPGEGRR